MAKEQQQTTGQTQAAVAAKIEKPQAASKPEDHKSGILFGLLSVLVAIIIMLGILGAAFYIIMHNNINGLGERYRTAFQHVPLLKLALPAVKDPGDPKYLTEDEIKNRYQSLRQEKTDLLKQLADANTKIAELSKLIDQNKTLQAENDKVKSDAKAQAESMAAQQKQLDEDRKKVVEMIATGDLTGFQAYFEKVDKDTAAKIYTQIMQQQKASADMKNFAAVYEKMEPASAASIFEQMGDTKISMITDILKNMKNDISAQILAAMTPAFASKVTDALSGKYLGSLKSGSTATATTASATTK